MRPLPALPHLANCGRAGGHQKKGKKEEKHWNAPQCQGGPAGPAAHGQARRAGGLKEEHGKRRNAKLINKWIFDERLEKIKKNKM